MLSLGNYKKAYTHEVELKNLRTRIINEASERAILEIEANYQHMKQEASLLRKENALLQKNTEVSQLRLIIIGMTLAGFVILVFFGASRLRLQQRSNRLLEQKNADLTNSNAALERFAYVASHDLKEPLRTIGSFTTLLKRRFYETLNTEGREYIDFVSKAVDQMYQLLDDLLEYSLLIHKKDISKQVVNLNEVVADITDNLKHSIDEKNVQLSVDQLPQIQSNTTHMHQLFQNLLANAIKFNDKADPKVQLQYRRKGDEHVFEVKDNGIGISKEYHSKIFNAFQRLSKDEYPGTGVGLAICEKIVEQHQGRIWLESKEGEGTTFYFSFPAQEN